MDFADHLWLSCNKLSLLNTCSSKEYLVPDTERKHEPRDVTDRFLPKFDSQGLLTAVVVDATNGDVLMVAFMNREALDATASTGFAHFWSRSRKSLWKKGETSGNLLQVVEILVDCDQDALVIRADPAGPACHTGARSCFYRRLDSDTLVRVRS